MKVIKDKVKYLFSEEIILFLLALIFIIPQIIQQIVLDLLPSTGDPVHKRMVHFLTNFPNVFNEVLISETGHSKLFHYHISYYNLLAGFTEDKSFYGFVAFSLMALIAIMMIVFMFAKRMKLKYPLLAVLLFLSSPFLVFPFLGQANQYLIYLFLPLAIFVIFFIQARFRTQCALLFLIGATLSSHFIIWLPVFFIVLGLEWLYPRYHSLIFLPLGVLLFWPFIGPPFMILVGKYSALVGIGAMSLGAITILILYKLLKNKTRWSKILMTLVGGILLFMFTYPFQGGFFVESSLSENLYNQAIAFKGTNFFEYFFGTGKNWAGSQFYGIFFSIASVISVVLWFKNKNKIQNEDHKRITGLMLLVVIPASMVFLKFIFLTLQPFYFIGSYIGQLHPIRLAVMSFFFFPLLFFDLAQYWQSKWTKFIVMGLSIILVVNIALISQFFFMRTEKYSTQKLYFQSIRTAILEFSAYGYELEYQCYYQGTCDKLLQHK